MHEDDDADFRSWEFQLNHDHDDPLAAARGYLIGGSIGLLLFALIVAIVSWKQGWF